jgi:undecaprenyl pyrophosphate phosphatase UppP
MSLVNVVIVLIVVGVLLWLVNNKNQKHPEYRRRHRSRSMVASSTWPVGNAREYTYRPIVPYPRR